MRPQLKLLATAAVGAFAIAGVVVAPAKAQRTSPPATSGSTPATSQPALTASAYFDRARRMGFLAAGQSAPYVLHAEFTTRGSNGVVETGTYTDTWASPNKWRREAKLGKSTFVRSRNGHRWYRLSEGPDAALLQYVLTAMEPLPATDQLFTESDWRVTPSTVDGAPATRVATGKENPDGTPDPKQFYGFWFNPNGQLIQTYGNGLETQRSDFEDYSGVEVARKIDIRKGDELGMSIAVTQVGPTGKLDPHMFSIKGHDWDRAYTFEVR